MKVEKLKDFLLKADANVICRSTKFSELQAIKLATQRKSPPLMSVGSDGVIKIDPKVFKELFGVDPVKIAKRIEDNIRIDKEISRYLDTKEEN